MVFISSSPVYNTILFYILFVSTILIIKPCVMYCNETKKFKSFGCGKGQTIVCFPLVCISSVIILYFIFLIAEIVGEYLDKK